MGLFDKIFSKPEKRREAETYFRTLTAYQPVFTSWNGAIYESELVRASIDTLARHAAKLKFNIVGAAKPKLQTELRKRPNKYSTWYQFLYRVMTILQNNNTCFLVPVYDRSMEMTGYWPALPTKCTIIETKDGTEWLEYHFTNGQVGAVEMAKCGIVTRMQYKDDFFGENNRALNPTMDLISMTNQGIKEGIKNSATFRFMARLTNFKDPEDMKAEQKQFSELNFSDEDAGGFLLFPNTYDNIQQVQSSPYKVDAEQMNQIRTNVFNYFGVNEKVLQNTAVGDELDAFYEGIIEPFAIQVSEVMTAMTFTDRERGEGSYVILQANRLQYMTTANKIQFVSQLGDRGLITVNEARELLNYPPVEGGDVRPARGEYYFIGEDGTTISKDEEDEDGNQE